MTTLTAQPTAADYARIFEAERARTYPVVDALEEQFGYALDRTKLEMAARVLACPLKANPPNWQHGRVLYAAARAYFATHPGPATVLDIGTAKGFSALCLFWALSDAGTVGQVHSVDVLDPDGTERRNTVVELDGPVTLRQILAPWPETAAITFHKSTGIAWLEAHPKERVRVAFVDGKHSHEAVATEARLLAARQKAGDLVVFDDVQIEGVQAAIESAHKWYDLTYLDVMPGRRYASAVRRG